MNLKNSLVVGIIFTVFTLGFMFLFTSKSFAATATTEQQLKDLAGTITVKDDNTLTGKLENTTITFTKKTTQANSAAFQFTNSYKFEATNLDCDGEKATVSMVPTNTTSMLLSAKYKENSQCKSPSNEIYANVTVDSSGTPTGTSGTQSESDNCVAKDSGPLGWILCPVVGAITTSTNFLFQNLINPFLEDVPISLNEKDGTYQAWKTFRLLGNIMLVVTMIVVVYAQIRE